MTKTLLALAAFASAAMTMPASAQSVRTSVKTADLNLATAGGRERLSRRISSAAKTLCIVDGDRSLVAMVNSNKCYDAAVASARSQSDAVRVASAI